jgi:hypothetical protein
MDQVRRRQKEIVAEIQAPVDAYPVERLQAAVMAYAKDAIVQHL